MRGIIIPILLGCLIIVSAQPLALGKKNKKDTAARLKSLQTIYVDGSSTATSYVRKHLSQETCLLNAPDQSVGDAILDIEEVSPVPCGVGMGSSGLCSSMTLQLIDTKTNEALWATTDDHLPLADVIHQMHGRYDWVLWNLKTVCCKGRPIPAQPKDSAP